MAGPRTGRDKVRPKWLIPLIASASLALIVILGSLIISGQNKGVQPEGVLEETSTLDPDLRERVENLLEVADVHMLVGRMLEPPGSSAYDAYQQVLVMHQHNKQANQGLQRLGDQIEERVREAIQTGKLEAGRKLLDKALDALPRHQGLIELQKEL